MLNVKIIITTTLTDLLLISFYYFRNLANGLGGLRCLFIGGMKRGERENREDKEANTWLYVKVIIEFGERGGIDDAGKSESGQRIAMWVRCVMSCVAKLSEWGRRGISSPGLGL